MWESLICSMCRDFYDKPKILPCVHSVCEQCLGQLLSQVKQKDFPCPVCRAAVHLPPGGIANIPDNVFLNNVLDIMKREIVLHRDESVCDACSLSVLTNLRCEDCDMLLCTKCLHAHRDKFITSARKDKVKDAHVKTSDTRSTHVEASWHNGRHAPHKFSTGEEIFGAVASTSEQHQVRMRVKCKQHIKEDLRFFCSSCAQLACQDCVIAKHITHIFVSASDAVPSSKAQLYTLLNQVAIRIMFLSEALRDVKDTEDQLRSCVAHITNRLRNEFIESSTGNLVGRKIGSVAGTSKQEQKLQNEENGLHCKESIRRGNQETHLKAQHTQRASEKEGGHDKTRTRSKILNDLAKLAQRKFGVLSQHRAKLEMRLRLIENCKNFTQHLLESGCDEEILMIDNCIIENLGDLCQRTPDVPIECPEDSFIRLIGPESGSLQGVVENEGNDLRVVTGDGCGSCSFATGEGLTNATVGQDCSFTVTIKNEQNKICDEGRSSLTARIKTPNGAYFRAELVEHKPGKHKFRYRTYTAGPHVLRISLRGEEILGSPFEASSNGSTDYSRRGRLVAKFGKRGSAEGELLQPRGLAVDRLSRIYVADTGNNRLQVFDESGRFLFAFGREGSERGEFNEPCDVAISQTSHVIVADKFNDRLQLFTSDGKFVRQVSDGITQPTAVATNQHNNILLVDSNHSRVLVFTISGERLRSITRGSTAISPLVNVQGIACNQTGETFVVSRISAAKAGIAGATTQNHPSFIQVFDNNGTYIREFVTPSCAQEASSCRRLVTDNDDRVLVVGSGNKVQVFTPMGGHLTNISFTENDCTEIQIAAIALSPNESVVVVDKLNCRIIVF